MLSASKKISLVVLNVYTDAIAIAILAFIGEALYRAAVFTGLAHSGLESFILISLLVVAALFIPFRLGKAVRLYRALSCSSSPPQA